MIIKFEGIKGEKMLEKFFKLKQNNTDVKTEITAGITTFMTMAYILAVNPSILSEAGMDANAVLIATCLASFIGTLCMAFMANMPFALSAGMGLNAYMAYTIVSGQGVSWQMALFAVFIEGMVNSGFVSSNIIEPMQYIPLLDNSDIFIKKEEIIQKIKEVE